MTGTRIWRPPPSRRGSVAYRALRSRLIEAGVPGIYRVVVTGRTVEIACPVDALVDTGISALPYEDILLESAPLLRGEELRMVVQVLTERGMKRAGPFMVSLFRSRPESSLLWDAANALRVIRDKRTFSDVIHFAADRRFGCARHMLMGLLATIRTDAAYEVLVECLSQDDERSYAIEALGRFGRPEAIPLIEALDPHPRLSAYRAKRTALRRLRKKLNV